MTNHNHSKCYTRTTPLNSQSNRFKCSRLQFPAFSFPPLVWPIKTTRNVIHAAHHRIANQITSSFPPLVPAFSSRLQFTAFSFPPLVWPIKTTQNVIHASHHWISNQITSSFPPLVPAFSLANQNHSKCKTRTTLLNIQSNHFQFPAFSFPPLVSRL